MSGLRVARAMGALFGPGPDQVLYGTVASIATVLPDTVDVYIGNSPAGVSPSAATGLPYSSAYTPAVGDAVCVLHGQGSSRSSYFVLGVAAGSPSGGGIAAAVPVGSIMMFPVTVTYTNWLLCNGGTFSSTTYPALYSLLGSTTLPDLRDTLPMGAHTIVSLGATAGSQTSTGLVAHTHGGPSHTHTSAAHSHNHNHNDTGHSHGHNHSYSEPVSAGSEYAAGTLGGLTVASANTGSDSTSGSANIANDATSTTPGATGSASGTTGSAGSGSSFSVLNPVLGVNWYIRAA